MIYKDEVKKRLGDSYENNINKQDSEKLLIFDKELNKTIKTKNTKQQNVLEL